MFEYVWKCFKETSHDCVPHGSIVSFSCFFFVYSSLHAVHVTNKLSSKVLGVIADFICIFNWNCSVENCLNEENVSGNFKEKKPTDYIMCKRFVSNSRTLDKM